MDRIRSSLAGSGRILLGVAFVLLCLVLAFVRLFKPEAVVDATTVWLIGIAVAVFLLPQVLPYVSRIEGFGIKAELNRIKQDVSVVNAQLEAVTDSDTLVSPEPATAVSDEAVPKSLSPTTSRELAFDDFPDTTGNSTTGGSSTPRSAFRLPILKALVEKGGSASIQDVLLRVEQLIGSGFTAADYELYPATPNQRRWQVTARLARADMIQDGLLKGDSPPGRWEITRAGREAFEALSRGT